MRKFLAAALAIFIIAPAVFFYMDFRGWVKDADEAAWLFSTPYFRHFICGDMAHPDWKDMDALDHPPLAKYFYGAALAVRGVEIDDLSYKKQWRVMADSKLLVNNFLGWISDVLPAGYIEYGRQASFLLYVLNMALFFVIIRRFFSRRAALLAAIFTAYNIPFTKYGVLVMAESLLLFWALAGIFLSLLWYESLSKCERGSRAWISAAAVGIAAGLGFSTKLNGILILVPMLWVVFELKRNAMKTSQPNFKTIAAQIFLALFLCLALSFILNPALHVEPVETLRQMFMYRMERIEAQRTIFPEHYLPAWIVLLDLAGVLCNAQTNYSWLPSGAVFVSISLAGLLLRKYFHSDPKRRIVYFAGAMWMAQSLAAYLRLGWTHYLFLAWPWLGLFAAVSADNFIRAISERAIPGREILKYAGFVLAIATAIFISGHVKWNYVSFMSGLHPPEYYIKQYEIALQIEPENKDFMVGLAERFIEVGNEDAAKDALLKALALDPGFSPALKLMDKLNASGVQ